MFYFTGRRRLFRASRFPFSGLERSRKNVCSSAYLLFAERNDAVLATGSRGGPTWTRYSPVTSVPCTIPLRVCSPLFDPSFQVNAALPFTSLTARLGVTTPDFTEKFTRASGTGFP